MLNKLIIFLVLFCSTFYPIESRADQTKEPGIIALMYHRFDENKYPTTNIRLHDFRRQIDIIKKTNLSFINIDELKEILIKKKEYNEKKILLTIDDAFQSFYKNAWPILKENKIPFILFVNTREININHPNYMNWEQIKEIHNSKLGVIGAHSFSHEYLVKLNADDIKKDIQQSNNDYLKELGAVPEIFSYPFGEYSLEIKKIIKESGYLMAFGQHSGVIHKKEDLFELPRFPINEDYGKMDRFNFVINTSPLSFKFFKPEDKLINNNNPPNIEIEFEDNVKNINCFTNEGGKWKNSEIAFLDENWIRILLKEEFKPRRGKINCTIKLENKTWGWFGRQFVIND